MKAIFKKLLLVLVAGFAIFGLVACQPTEKPQPSNPSESTKVETTPTEVPPSVSSGDSELTLAQIQEDIDALGQLEIIDFQVERPTRGTVNQSRINWSYLETNNVTSLGVVLPYNEASTSKTFIAKGRFTLDGITVEHDFELSLPEGENTVINHVKEVNFKNLTDEYKVENTTFNIYQNAGGHVPYVSIPEWIELLRGLIDPSVDFTYVNENGKLTVTYEYFGDEVETLELVADSATNELTTNDMGFFYGFIESTETNFSRNIWYEIENPLNNYIEGDGLYLDLSRYSMEVIEYEGEILIPLYVANLLFANSNYYSVYYNQDNMHGLYFTPESSEQLNTIQKSSFNNKRVPGDLVVHNFNYLALFFDNFYGLKEYAGVDTYYEELLDRRNDLAVTNAEKFDEGLFEFLYKSIDENHTDFGEKSYFQRLNAKGPQLTSTSQFGPNVNSWYSALYSIDTQIGRKFGEAISGWHAGSGMRPNYWFIEDEILVVIFDSFRTADIVEDVVYNPEIVTDILDIDNDSEIPVITEGNRFIYYNTKTEDYSYMQVLIKGASQSYVDAYNAVLLSEGYEDKTGTNPNIPSVFFKETLSQEYTIQTQYVEDFELFYFTVIVKNASRKVDISHGKLLDTIASDSAIYLEMYIEKALREKPTITSAVLDITWNTGGNVGALYRVLGLLFNESFVVSNYSPNINERSTRVVKVIPPVSYEHLNWHILASKVSFSAANMLATVVKQNKLAPIIGQTTGGGAASVAPVYLPIGTVFTSSSTNVSVFVTGDNTEENPYTYEINEGGIVPDHTILISEIYDEQVLKSIILGQD